MEPPQITPSAFSASVTESAGSVDPAAIASLTEREKECLRLFLVLGNSKDSASAMGISPGRVNKIAGEAMRKLGVKKRGIAAHILARHEAEQGAPQADPRMGAHSIPLVEPENFPPDEPVVEPSGTQRESLDELAEDLAPYGKPWSLALSLPLPFPTIGRPRNDLNSFSTILAIMGITFLGAGVVGSVVSFVTAVNNLVAGLRGGS
jgi:DNA-binding CsgD family transcriptional regulator